MNATATDEPPPRMNATATDEHHGRNETPRPQMNTKATDELRPTLHGPREMPAATDEHDAPRITPTAFANSSPGLAQPWGLVPPFNSTLKALANQLMPYVPLIVINFVRLQERAILILERYSLMVLLLVFDVRDHVFKIRLADCKCGVPSLPMEVR